MELLSSDDLIYHINSLELCRVYFYGLIESSSLAYDIDPFVQSVSKSPIDSSLDVIRYYLQDFQQNWLKDLGNPRSMYAPALHRQLRGQKPVLDKIAHRISFLSEETERSEVQFEYLYIVKSNFTLALFYPRYPTMIAKQLHVPLMYLERLVHSYFNPWEVVAYEYLTSRVYPFLLDIDPYACFLDCRSSRNHRTYALRENLLSAEDLALPKFFSASVAVGQSSFRKALRLVERMHLLASPSQIALAIALVYKYVENSIKEQLSSYQQQKQLTRRLESSQRFYLADANYNIELLRFEADETSLETSGRQTQIPPESDSHENTSEMVYQMRPAAQCAATQEAASPAVFGADEITPVMIFLIVLAKPKHLNRLIAAAELFSLPFIIRLPAVEYAVLMLKSAGIAFSNGFDEYKVVTVKRKYNVQLHGTVEILSE